MAEEEKTRLISTEFPDSPTTKMAEEVHPLPAEKPTSGKLRGSLRADSSTEQGGEADGEDEEDDDSSTPKRKRSCPMYFGVRSYLHHFYDKAASYKDPAVYEDDDDLYLTQSYPRHSRRRCPPIWWKIFMWVGVNLLFFGMVGILVGYLVPPKVVIVGENKPAAEWYIDTGAKKYNTALDACKLIGLVLFCIGGITLAMSLLFPSFLHYCHEDEDDDYCVDEGCKVPLRAPEDVEEGVRGPLSPVEMSIPASSQVKNVQPTCKAPQSMLSQPDSVIYKD